MKEFLYKIVEYIAKIHNFIMRLNDRYEYNFTDKQLHFFVIGILGMAMIFAFFPLRSSSCAQALSFERFIPFLSVAMYWSSRMLSGKSGGNFI